MPIWLRMFTFHKIQEYYENQNKQTQQAQSGGNKTTLVDSQGNVNREQFKKLSNETKIPQGFSVPKK
jgi:hypothetical protein